MKRFLILLLMTIFFYSGRAECPGNPFVDFQAEVFVFRVIDGDTFIFTINNEEFGVRILGVDCFETRRNDRLEKQALKAGISIDSAYILGHRAKHLVDSLICERTIKITRESIEVNFDTYARLLRHAWFEGKKIADILIENGLNVPPNE